MSAQNIPLKSELKGDCGIEFNLVQCPMCSLVQLDCDPVDYYRKVIRAGGGSSTMKELRRSQYKRFYDYFNLKGKKIIEIGCGKGEFLSIWDEFDVYASGIEYSKELTDLGRKNGMNIFNDFIDDPKQTIMGAPYDAFCQFNFLEHQPNPNEMVKGIYNNLTEDGVGLVTVPSLEYILEHNGYYELISDHIAYYSEYSLKLLFEKNGFEVCEIRSVNRDTHEVLVKKRRRLEIYNWVKNYDNLKSEINEFLSKFPKVAVWGASHQGFTLISSMEIGDRLEYIIDSAKFKQGRYAPASHVKIVAPDYFHESPVDSILIVAPGYTDEINNLIRNQYGPRVSVATLRSNHIEYL